MITEDNGVISGQIDRNAPVEIKPIAPYGYGGRCRVAYLWSNYEQMFGHTLTVAGWAKTTRMGGKDFAFIALSDGSCTSII
jgi:hypothetical protein